MLKSLDVVIGFSVIMLVVSVSVTVIMQWLGNVLEWRGKHLVEGVASLVRHIDPELISAATARKLAERVLEHPMLNPAGGKLAAVVQREELITIILDIAAGAATGQPTAAAAVAGAQSATAPSSFPPATPTAVDPETQLLRSALKTAGIDDPAQALAAIRTAAMRLEAAEPQVAAHVRNAKAIIEGAGSRFVASMNGWFDQTMDRVSQNFTRYMKRWAACVALAVAIILQLDAFTLINRLSMDDQLRVALLNQAQNPPALEAQGGEDLNQLRALAASKLVTVSGDPVAWWNTWSQRSVLGVLLSAMLLNLGAPFWFDALKNLLKLRPLLAAKEDEQRKERQTAQPAAA